MSRDELERRMTYGAILVATFPSGPTIVRIIDFRGNEGLRVRRWHDAPPASGRWSDPLTITRATITATADLDEPRTMRAVVALELADRRAADARLPGAQQVLASIAPFAGPNHITKRRPR